MCGRNRHIGRNGLLQDCREGVRLVPVTGRLKTRVSPYGLLVERGRRTIVSALLGNERPRVRQEGGEVLCPILQNELSLGVGQHVPQLARDGDHQLLLQPE